jgi:hypothetical protein
MVALAFYLAFLGAACAFALVDWRRGWLLVIVCTIIQDGVRKLTPAAPVWISFLVVVLYAVIIFSARQQLIIELRDFGRRFGSIYTVLLSFAFLLLLSAVTGMVTFGFSNWRVPLLSLITYLVPFLAMLLGYTWLQREAAIDRFLYLYSAAISIALIGTLAEYFRLQWPVLGMVSFSGDYIRHLPGIQIRMLSGVFRGPDIMALHAATLTSIGIAFALRAGVGRRMLLWGGVATWGFLNCMLSGRRKALYFIVVFVVAFLFRYARRVRTGEIMVGLAMFLVLYAVIQNLKSSESTNPYAAGAVASQSEIRQRFEGGALETLSQYGFMGAGLGSATQGVHHLLGARNLGWQEGGLGKLAAEVGLPGIVALLILAYLMGSMLLRLTAIGDVPGSSQFMRVTLFALVSANAASFVASAQAYSDAVLALNFGFLIGCLFATAALDERLVQQQPVQPDAVVMAPRTA